MKQSDRARVIAGKYELEKLLGQGGMGEVWVATELATGRKLAVKLLSSAAADSKESRARFEREAKIARTLVSPHIAQVTDSGVDDAGNPFMALELLHGEDLQKRIKSEKALPAPFVVRLAIQVGRALHVAHAAGLVHRDLKPANIFLARQGDEEVIKVLDFGIAKMGSTMENTQYTAAGAMLGTQAYMSPEQIRNAKTVDHRADLWAFAVVLFRALTGEMPFEETGFDLFLALARDPIPTPLKVTSFVPGLPAPLNVFFERAFSQDMAQRYPNASAMVVGFCRAGGVTVPADVLYAADALMNPPTSGLRDGTSPPSAPNPPPISASPVSLPSPMSLPSPSAAAPPAAPSAVADEPSHALSGTVMLDAMPVPTRTGSHPGLDNGAPGRPAAPAAPNPMLQMPAAGPPGVFPEPPGLDPDEPDNAATLFYQPALPAPPAASPESRAPISAPSALAERVVPVTPAERRAPEAPAARAARAARIWVWLMVGLVLALAAGALVFLFLGRV